MKPKHLVVLVVVCAVVTVIGLLVHSNRNRTWQRSNQVVGQKVVEDFPINDIRKLRIRTSDGELVVAREGEAWVVPGMAFYPADFTKVAELLKDFSDLKATQVVQVGEKDRGRLELNPPDADADTGTLVECIDADDKVVTSLLFGKEHQSKSAGGPGPMGMMGGFPNGRYLLTPKGAVVLVGETFSQVSTEADSWVDKTFLKVDKIIKGSARKNGEVLWTVSRKDKDAKLTVEGLAENEEADSGKLSSIDSSLRYPSFNKVAGTVEDADAAMFEGAVTFVAETPEGRTYTLEIGKKQESDYPVRIAVAYTEPPLADGPEGESDEDRKKREEKHAETVKENRRKAEEEQARYGKWVYLVSSYVVDDLLLPREDLVKQKEAEKKDEKEDGNAEPEADAPDTPEEADQDGAAADSANPPPPPPPPPPPAE